MLTYKPCVNTIVIMKQGLLNMLCFMAISFFILRYKLFGYSLFKCLYLCLSVYLWFLGSVVMQSFGKS